MSTPTYAPYLQRQPSGIYYVRIAVPPRLRPILGRREIHRSLRTRDRREAFVRAGQHLAETFLTFEKHGGEGMDLEALKAAAQRRQFTMRNVRIGDLTIDEIEIDPSRKGDAEAAFAALQALQGQRSGGSVPAAYTEQAEREPERAPADKPAPLLSELIPAYLDHKVESGDWSAATRLDQAGKFDVLLQLIDDRPVDEINLTDAKEFLESLRRVPRRIRQRFGDISVQRAMSLAASLPPAERDVLSPTTISKFEQVVHGFFDYLRREGHIESSPFEQLRREEHTVRRSRQRRGTVKHRRAFTAEELTRLFTTAQYRDHRYLHPHRYWLPLIGLYTGARINEICQLHVTDIVEVNGVRAFDFNDRTSADGEKRIKTMASHRQVPIHAKLLELGFEEFVRTRTETDPSGRLFPELRWYPKGGYGRRRATGSTASSSGKQASPLGKDSISTRSDRPSPRTCGTLETFPTNRSARCWAMHPSQSHRVTILIPMSCRASLSSLRYSISTGY